MKKSVSIFFILFLTCVIVDAQNARKIWSLQDCIDYALTNNIQIKQQQLSTQLAKINLSQSKTNILPNLNSSASHAYNTGKTIDMYTNEFASNTVQSDNFYLSSSVTLFNGFQLLNTIKQNKINLEASRFDLDKMMNDISLNISVAYLQILYNIELLNVAASQLEITKQQVTRTQKLVDAGSLAKGSLLTLEAQEASEELSMVNAQNTLDLSYLTLVQILDMQSVDSFKIETPKLDINLETSLITQPEQIYAYAIAAQPEIKSAELKVKSSNIDLSLAQGLRSPIISLRGTYGTGFSGASKSTIGDPSFVGFDTVAHTFELNPKSVVVPKYNYQYETKPFMDQINDNVNKSISFSLTVPIFNSWQVNNGISKAKIAIKNSEYTLQTAKNTLYKTIQQSYADAKAALNKYKYTQKSLEALTESFKYTEQKFEVGLVNTIEYNDAKNKLTPLAHIRNTKNAMAAFCKT
ncbi:MAG: TolC family protein, partial [Bacteroidetes bacterium]|nr:TolC family protein [Bacteroidota bacterium]